MFHHLCVSLLHHLCVSLSTHVGQVQHVGVKSAFTLLSDDEDVTLVDINIGDGLNAFRGARAKTVPMRKIRHGCCHSVRYDFSEQDA